MTTRAVTPAGAASRQYAMVSSIQPGSPAALANLVCNVRILSVNGHILDTAYTHTNKPTQRVNDIIFDSVTKGAARIEFAALH
jgi:predicted metalloprotease with PDZ domain